MPIASFIMLINAAKTIDFIRKYSSITPGYYSQLRGV